MVFRSDSSPLKIPQWWRDELYCPVPLEIEKGLGEVVPGKGAQVLHFFAESDKSDGDSVFQGDGDHHAAFCLLYTSDAADE